MHIPLGFNKTELGDIDVIVHDNLFHLFHLCIHSHDRVEHLTSPDGLNWQPQKPVLFTGSPGDFDDDQIWTMGVFAHAGRFFMLYTGLSTRDRGKVQRVGLATSPDLFTWTKQEKLNPVACADPRWYEAAADARHRVDWRDPKVFSEHGVLHAVIAARTNTGPVSRRGCAGYFTSTDGFHWEVKPPLHVLNTCYDFETPALCKLNDRYYLTGIHGRNSEGQIPNVFRVAEQVQGPYRRTAWDALLPGANYVFKPCTWRGTALYFHNLRGIADWASGGGQTLSSVAVPKVADTLPDGSLVLRPFPHWDPVALGPAKTACGASWLRGAKIAQGQWGAQGQELCGTCEPGLGGLLFEDSPEHFILEMQVNSHDARELGLLWRCDAQADLGTFLSINPAVGRIELYTQRDFHKTPFAGVTYAWRGRRVVQESLLPMTLREQSFHLRLVVYGPYVEVSVNNRVLISALTMHEAGKHVGVFTEDGSVTIGQISLRAMRAPACLKNCD